MAFDSIPEEVKTETLRMREDLVLFARKCLKIRTKTGEIKPLTLNRGQLFLHERLEAQRLAGKPVRALIVKGRQMGISTYLQARFYWRLWGTRKGTALNAFILTHEQPATDNLFGMAQRFHDYMPEAVKPATKAANAKELVFAGNECGYQVATAGSKEVGRSATIQLLHGSEVPSWPNAETHVVSLLTTALAKGPGTEGILEATAKGVGNVFYHYAQAAIRGDSEYEAIFIPWFWDDGYRIPCPKTFEPSSEWQEYAFINKLEWDQLFWAFTTNRELARAMSLDADKPCWAFKQEYPANFDEAFQSSGNSFIPATSVLRARIRKPDPYVIGRGPIILGVDPARSRDKVGIIDRCGRRMGERICQRMDPGGNSMYVAAQLARIIDRIKPDAVNIDVGADGGPIYDWLVDKGYTQCNAVNFGSAPIGRGPTGEDMYLNRRAEMWDELRAWFEGDQPVQIPDDDGLHADLTSAEWGPGATRYNTNNELILEEKQKIKERLGASPDLGDAAALTFAVPWAQGREAHNQPRPKRRTGRAGY